MWRNGYQEFDHSSTLNKGNITSTSAGSQFFTHNRKNGLSFNNLHVCQALTIILKSCLLIFVSASVCSSIVSPCSYISACLCFHSPVFIISSPPFGTSVSIGSRKSIALSSSACWKINQDYYNDLNALLMKFLLDSSIATYLYLYSRIKIWNCPILKRINLDIYKQWDTQQDINIK